MSRAEDVDSEDIEAIEDSFSSGGNGGGSGGSSLTASVTWAAIKAALPTPVRIVLVAIAGLGVASAGEIAELVRDPRGYIEGVIIDYVYLTLLRPAAVAVWTSGIETVTSFLIAGFGSDLRPGVSPGSSVGLVDIPFAFGAAIVGALAAGSAAILGGINSVNTQVATALVEPLGIAALPLVAGFWAVEISVLLYAVWFVIQAADVFTAGTIDQVIDLAQIPARPVRNLLEGLFG